MSLTEVVTMNVTGMNVTNKTDVIMPRHSGSLIIPALMFFLGSLGNILALFILICKTKKDKKSSAFYRLVIALACMDLFGIVASSPAVQVVYIKGGGIKDVGGMPLCRYFSFLMLFAGLSTEFTVLVMAIERYMVTRWPFKYSDIVTPWIVNVTIAGIWGLSSLIALVPTVGFVKVEKRFPSTWCFFDYRDGHVSTRIYSFVYVFVSLLCILVTAILNTIVFWHIWRMRRKRLRNTMKSRDSITGVIMRPNTDAENRMLAFLVSIIVTFTVCYAPFMFRILINQIKNVYDEPVEGGTDDITDLWTFRFACLNQLLDPWVYIISRVTRCGCRQGPSASAESSPRPPKYINQLLLNLRSLFSAAPDQEIKTVPYLEEPKLQVLGSPGDLQLSRLLLTKDTMNAEDSAQKKIFTQTENIMPAEDKENQLKYNEILLKDYKTSV